MKEYRREKRRERKKRGRPQEEEEGEEEGEAFDPEMAAVMGFSGFGGSKRKAT